MCVLSMSFGCPFSDASHPALAEGNPDEEKIGAFGVGGSNVSSVGHVGGQSLD